MGIFWVVIILDGNSVGGNCPSGSYPGCDFPKWEFSGWELSGENHTCGSFLGGKFRSTLFLNKK